jgi:hypothetical protein
MRGLLRALHPRLSPAAQRFPHLAERIDIFYGRAKYAPNAYDGHMRIIFNRICEPHGFPMNDRYVAQTSPTPHSMPAQLDLKLTGC